MTKANTIFLFRNAAADRNAGAALPTQANKGFTGKLTSLGRQAVASALMLMLVPLSMGDALSAFGQDAPPPPPPDYGAQQGSVYQPLPPEELNRLVAPIALYPDSLVAQVLAASTYPAQVGSAEQFLQQYGGAPPEQIAQAADQQPWDPSVKALTAFPQVLQNLNQNMQWTTQLGNAYYNQPQDVMSAVQQMRQQAYAAGNLRPTQQLNVVYNPGAIVIEPVSPEVVYVPYYNPWVVYGAPIAPWGYYHYYGPPRGVGFGVGLAIGFGVGVAIGAFTHFGWGYHNWAPNWHDRAVVYNHNTYISNSVTVINHGNYGNYDRNPQARAFNHMQATQFANVNHTTINNVNVNRTNINNVNRTNINNTNTRNNFSSNNRPGASGLNAQSGFNPRTPQNFSRTPQQTGQMNNTARPAGQPGQFNNSARPVASGQLNGGARPGQQGTFNSGARPAVQSGQVNQFNQGARPNMAAPQSTNRNVAPSFQQRPSAPAYQQRQAAPSVQQRQAAPPQREAPHAAAPKSESHAEGHGEGHGEHHH